MISVIVPCYNIEKYIGKTIESILSNTFQDFELLLINDGSTDKTLEICESYKKNSDKIQIISQENRGLSGARNTGIDHSHGEFICFIDGDDIVETTYFEELYRYIKDNHLDWVECATSIYLNEHKKIIQEYYPDNRVYKDEQIDEEVIHHIFYTPHENITRHSTAAWASIYRKNAIGNLRFNESATYAEDITFNYEFMSQCKGYGYINKPLYRYLTYHSVISGVYRRNFIEEIGELIERIEVIRLKLHYNLTDAELMHVFNKFLSIFAMHTFKKKSKKDRFEDYQKVNLLIQKPMIHEVYEKINTKICDVYSYQILIYLFKHKQYELLYYLWIIKNKILKF